MNFRRNNANYDKLYNEVLKLFFDIFYIYIYIYIHRVRKKYGNPEKISKNISLRKMFQIKVVGFKKVYSIVLSVSPWLASLRSSQSHLEFFKWNTLFFITYSYCPSQYLFKAL